MGQEIEVKKLRWVLKKTILFYYAEKSEEKSKIVLTLNSYSHIINTVE